jgi:tetratricopeptide (TPR) repeat protein
MKKLLLGILLTFILSTSQGQDQLKIEYEAIKQVVSDQANEYYYPKLLNRYNEFDPSLTLQEYALLYYGFAFQEAYLKNQLNETKLTHLEKQQDYTAVIEECEKILALDPVSLKANNSMGRALYKLGKPEFDWKKYQTRYRTLRKVIVYSGNGTSPETAFKVIYISDEYNIIHDYFEIPQIIKQSLVEGYDQFEVAPSQYFKASKIYFDISLKLNRQNSLLSGKE